MTTLQLIGVKRQTRVQKTEHMACIEAISRYNQIRKTHYRIGETAECRMERDPGGPNLDLREKYETGLE